MRGLKKRGIAVEAMLNYGRIYHCAREIVYSREKLTMIMTVKCECDNIGCFGPVISRKETLSEQTYESEKEMV